MYSSRLLLLAPLVQGCRCRAATLVAATHAVSPRWRALEPSPRHSSSPAATARSSSGHGSRGRGINWGVLLLGAAAGVSGLGLVRYWKDGGGTLLPQIRAAGRKDTDEEMKSKVSQREILYKDFASYVYKGEPYMSARDFLETVTRDEPRSEWVRDTLSWQLWWEGLQRAHI